MLSVHASCGLVLVDLPGSFRVLSLTQNVLNTLLSMQNCRHIANDNFKCIFMNENVWISLKISRKCVPNFRITNIPALVNIMAWRHLATIHYLSQWWLVYWRMNMHHSASMGLIIPAEYGEWIIWSNLKYLITKPLQTPWNRAHNFGINCTEPYRNLLCATHRH